MKLRTTVALASVSLLALSGSAFAQAAPAEEEAAGELERAIDVQRGRFQRHFLWQVLRPGEAKLADIGGGDLGQAAVAGLVGGALRRGPVFRLPDAFIALR
jgi:hypothetical protein